MDRARAGAGPQPPWRDPAHLARPLAAARVAERLRGFRRRPGVPLLTPLASCGDTCGRGSPIVEPGSDRERQEGVVNRNFLYVMVGLVLGVILGIASFYSFPDKA